jgi:DNA repair photolyase
MVWDKTQITDEHGNNVKASSPVIISASRSTDIPAFYANWFLHRLKTGYSAWINPFNGAKSYISYQRVRLIVFWSKNPHPLLPTLEYLDEKHLNYYIHFTLNDYENERWELGVPPLGVRVDTFKRLVDKVGFGKVIWRFDPLMLTATVSTEDLLRKIENVGNQLQGYTEKLVFSFAQIENYVRVKRNLKQNNINYRQFNEDDILFFTRELRMLNKKWNYTLSSCNENRDLTPYTVQHNKCIDDDLIIKYFSADNLLMDFLGIQFPNTGLFDAEKAVFKTKNNKDKGQRPYCCCIVSKDIGQYDTCPHGCVYCYANTSAKKAKCNYRQHNGNTFEETITKHIDKKTDKDCF